MATLGGLLAPPPPLAPRPRRRAGAGGSGAAPLAARAAVRGSLLAARARASSRLAVNAGAASGGASVGAASASGGAGEAAPSSAARADSGAPGAAPTDKERAKAEKAAAAAAAKAEKAALQAAAKEAKAAAAAEAKALDELAKQARAAERKARSEMNKRIKDAAEAKEKKERVESKRADAAAKVAGEEARRKAQGLSPLQIIKARELAEQQERRAARRAAQAAAAERRAAAGAGLAASSPSFAANAADGPAGAEDEASYEYVDPQETLAALLAEQAAADAAMVKVTTKVRILEAAPEMLLEKQDAEPVMKRWYTVTTRWGGEHLMEPKVAAVLSEAAAREGFTYMLITPRAATADDWERNQRPPRPTIVAGRELDAPGWPQNRGESLSPGQLLLRAPLSPATCLALRTTGVLLAGASKALAGLNALDTPPTPLSLNVLDKIRVAVNASPDEAKPISGLGAESTDAQDDAEAEGDDDLDYMQRAEEAAAADMAALELEAYGEGADNEGDDAPKDPVAEARDAEARLQRAVSAIAGAAARSKAMARGVAPPPPPLADQVAAYRAALLPPDEPSKPLGELLKGFRADLAQRG